MMAKLSVTWDALNERQRQYMKAIYDTDQEQEQAERERAARTRRSQPASQWRWMRHWTNPFTGDTPLKHCLRQAGLVDPGTGSTFEALATRGLIEVDYEGYDRSVPLVKMTPQGRKLVRSALAVKASTNKLPVGTLREWHWRALAAAYQAGNEGLAESESLSGGYGRIGWNTWLRLRDYKRHGKETPLVEEICGSYEYDEDGTHRWITSPYRFAGLDEMTHICITEEGKQYYRNNWQRYHEMYPDIDAPEPDREERGTVCNTPIEAN